ncbi:hypothetical protein NON20_11805 [Synechocystis sp. B12]|nr:hypothetical protein NON20_11805 [Synechocystis sp. B12]
MAPNFGDRLTMQIKTSVFTLIFSMTIAAPETTVAPEMKPTTPKKLVYPGNPLTGNAGWP